MPHPSVSALLTTGNDFDLLSRLKRRDPEALADVSDRYGALLYSLTSRIIGDSGVAQDLVAETLVEVWNRSVLLPYSHSGFGLWIFSLARNRAVEYRRNPRERLTRPIDRGLRATEDPRLFERLKLGADHLNRLRGMQLAFVSLDADKRRMFEMAYFDGLSQPEIAAELGQPLWTLEIWMKSALDALGKAAACIDNDSN